MTSRSRQLSETPAAPHRRIAWWSLAAGVVVWVGLAWVLVPWHPVPGGAPAPASAEAWFTAEQLSRASDYATPNRYLSWASLAASVAVAVLLAAVPRLRARVTSAPGPWWVRGTAAVVACLLIGEIVTLPFAVLLWRRSVEHGLSTLGWGGFARDHALNLGLTVVMTSAVVLILIGCARRWQRWWTAVAGTVLAGLVVVGSYVYPVVVEPLFNDFTSLPAGALRSDVMRLASEEGVHIDDVLVADASRRTTTVNAYVSGLGNSRRVVLYDTLVDTVPRAEVLSVVAHELAHAKNNDVAVGTALGAVGVWVAVAALGVAVGPRRRLDSERAVPGVLAVVALGSVLVAPVQNSISRAIETRADVVAVQTTADPDTAVNLQRQLAVRSLSDPQGPAWSAWWFGTHPRVLDRIAIAEQVGRESVR